MLDSTTLTLDLGTKTGFAVGFQGSNAATLMQTAVCGTWELLTEREAKEQRKNGLERLGDARYYRLRDRVIIFCAAHRVSRIVFEDVQFCRSVIQSQLWSSLRTALWEVGERLSIELRAVPVSTLKSFAGLGPNATKAEMETALHTRESKSATTFSLGDDNEIDARWLLCYTLAADEGMSAWTFGWKLREEQRLAARGRAVQRRIAKKKQAEALRADGYSRLDSIIKGLGEKVPTQVLRQSVTNLSKHSRHTLELPSHSIIGSVLKTGELRWRVQRHE